MKGISAIIATVLMLVIAISLAGMAFMYFQGMFTQQTGRIVYIEEGATTCVGSSATVYVKNIGTINYYSNATLIGVAGGTLLACNPNPAAAAVADVIGGGGAIPCANKLSGVVAGYNNIIVVGNGTLGPTNSAKGSVYC